MSVPDDQGLKDGELTIRGDSFLVIKEASIWNWISTHILGYITAVLFHQTPVN